MENFPGQQQLSLITFLILSERDISHCSFCPAKKPLSLTDFEGSLDSILLVAWNKIVVPADMHQVQFLHRNVQICHFTVVSVCTFHGLLPPTRHPVSCLELEVYCQVPWNLASTSFNREPHTFLLPLHTLFLFLS